MKYQISRSDWNDIVEMYKLLGIELFVWVDALSLEVDDDIVKFGLLKPGFVAIMKINNIKYIEVE